MVGEGSAKPALPQAYTAVSDTGTDKNAVQAHRARMWGDACRHALSRRVGRQQGLQPMSSRLWISPPARCGWWGQENMLWRAPLSPFKKRTSHTAALYGALSGCADMR